MRHCAKLPAMNHRPGCGVRWNMLRSSWPSPKPHTGPTRCAISPPNNLATSASWNELGDVGELHEAHLALDQQVGAADVEVVAAAARQVLELPAGVLLAE